MNPQIAWHCSQPQRRMRRAMVGHRPLPAPWRLRPEQVAQYVEAKRAFAQVYGRPHLFPIA